jgi:hypothetical protein
MPNCPVCGNNVPAGTQYCPACGTNLQQSYGPPAAPAPTPTPTYSPNYSYPQGGMGMPGTSKPQSNRKYILAIVGALIIGLIIGFFIGFSYPVAIDYTTVTGTVSVSGNRGTPDLIMFNSTDGNGNLTAVVQVNSNGCGPSECFLINLPNPDTYNVFIQWINTTTTPVTFGMCTASPSAFTPPNNQTATQNFSC